MINLADIVIDLDLAQEFVVYRSTGSFVKGRWVESASEQIKMTGVVSVMSQRELAFMPEGDRVSGAMVFHTNRELFVTRAGTEPGTSDKIMWRGEFYKLFNVFPYSDYGYYKAVGERMKGN